MSRLTSTSPKKPDVSADDSHVYEVSHWIVLGTGRLTIARAIGQIFFLDEVREVEVRKFSEEKKKKDIVGIRTLPIPLTDQCNYH